MLVYVSFGRKREEGVKTPSLFPSWVEFGLSCSNSYGRKPWIRIVNVLGFPGDTDNPPIMDELGHII